MTEARLSELERTLRLDAEFFRPEYLRSREMLDRVQPEPLSRTVKISDGNHFTISGEFQEEGIPYYRGQDVTGQFFVEQAQPVCIPPEAYGMPHMVRSHLRKGDVLLSIVGTIGELSLVSSPRAATCSCKLAILRPRKIKPGYLAVFLRSRFGQDQIHRFTRGAVQMGLLLEDMDQLRVPRFSGGLEPAVEGAVTEAKAALDRSADLYAEAEQTLLRALGLDTWQPPAPLTYERRASEAFGAGRLDAEHFQEKFLAVRERLREAGAERFVPLGDLLKSITNGHTPLRHDLTVGDVPFLCAEHVSDFEIAYDSEKRILEEHHRTELARTALRNGDVLLTIKGRVGNAALAEDVPGPVNINQDVALLRLKDELPKWYVLAVINSRLGKMLVDQLTTGGINPFLGLGNVKKLDIPVFPTTLMEAVADETQGLIRTARGARKQAHALLERAKRAVEIAIEEGEAAALAYLESEGADGAVGQAPPYEGAAIVGWAVPPPAGSPAGRGVTGQREPSARPSSYPAEQEPAPGPLPPPPSREGRGKASPRPGAAGPRHIPQAILAHLAPGRAYSKAELCAALHLAPAEWTSAIRELKESGKVVQTGERRGARYALAGGR